jgi:predicted secreted protein
MTIGTNVNTTAGTKLYISPTLPATDNKAGFDNLVDFVKVARITNYGEIAQGYTPVEYADVETRDTYTLKGLRVASELSIELGRVRDDAGQIAVKTAMDSDNDYSFKIVTQDNTIFYFVGKVISASLTLGDANSVTSNSVTIRVNNRVIEDIVGLFTLTYVAGTNGSIIGTKVQSVKSGGSGTAVYAAAANLYEFQKWNDDSVANPRTDTNVLANATYTASFVLSD